MKNNKVIIACAGAGKTYHICKNALSNHEKSLLVTYTKQGKINIINQIKELNNGILSNKVFVKTWFDFLLNDIIKPYQTIFFKIMYEKKYNKKYTKNKINFITGIDFETRYGIDINSKYTFDKFFNKHNKLLKINQVSRIASMILNHKEMNAINRLNSLYKNIFLDEFQDFIGSDLDVIDSLFNSSIYVTIVGDPKQFTYSTHESKKKKYKGKNIYKFFYDRKEILDIEYMNNSRRLNSSIANFANVVYPSKNPIIGINNVERNHQGIFYYDLKKDKLSINYIIENLNPIVLIYDKRSLKKVPNHCNFYTYGNSKGMTFDDIIIIPNNTFKELLASVRNPKTDNIKLDHPEKYYVAVTRARFSINFLM